MKKIIIDAHLHIYPFYNVETLFSSLNKNFNITLSKMDKNNSLNDSIKIGLLAERFDCSFFKDIISKEKNNQNEKIMILNTKENESIRIKYENSEFFLISGRQINTKECIEVLSYGTIEKIKDGMSLKETIQEILNIGSIPALPFAPGKWLFKRGEIIKKLLNEEIVKKCIFVDSSLRPLFWGMPNILKTAKKNTINILHGSDPLPFKGDEKNAGIFTSYIESEFDEFTPFYSLKRILYNKNIVIKGIYSKNIIINPINRILKNYLYR